MGKQEESNEMERKDVGIIAMEIYFPSMFISQKDLGLFLHLFFTF